MVFIYTKDEATRDLLLEQGYELFQDRSGSNGCWVFFNKKQPDGVFAAAPDGAYAISDVLTF